MTKSIAEETREAEEKKAAERAERIKDIKGWLAALPLVGWLPDRALNGLASSFEPFYGRMWNEIQRVAGSFIMGLFPTTTHIADQFGKTEFNIKTQHAVDRLLDGHFAADQRQSLKADIAQAVQTTLTYNFGTVFGALPSELWQLTPWGSDKTRALDVAKEVHKAVYEATLKNLSGGSDAQSATAKDNIKRIAESVAASVSGLPANSTPGTTREHDAIDGDKFIPQSGYVKQLTDYIAVVRQAPSATRLGGKRSAAMPDAVFAPIGGDVVSAMHSAQAEQQRVRALAARITQDIASDMGITAVSSDVAATVTRLVSTGAIPHNKVDQLIHATDGQAWNDILPKLSTASKVDVQSTDSGFKIQLSLPGGKEENFNTRPASTR